MYDGRVYTALTLAGTVPFMACAVLPLVGVESVPYLGPLDGVAASYGLAIVCFLAGAHWGIYLSGRSADSLNLFVISNVIFLAAWFAYIGVNLNLAIGVQVLAFFTLLFIDLRLKQSEVISAAYFRVRSAATLIAVIALLLVLVQ